MWPKKKRHPRGQKVFAKLRQLRVLVRESLPWLTTLEDADIVREIGFFQEQGVRVTRKLLLLANVGSIATVQRRLDRLRQLGVVVVTKSSMDGRTIELELASEVLRAYRKLDQLIATLW